MNTIGQQIRAHRQLQGVSMRGLARAVKMSPGALSEIERDLEDPGFNLVCRIAKELNMTIFTLATVEVKLCPVCKGKGTLAPLNYTHAKPCEVCNGKGIAAYKETGNEAQE